MRLALIDLDKAPFESDGRDVELPVGLFEVVISKKDLYWESGRRLKGIELIAGRKPVITEDSYTIKIRFEVVGAE